MIASATATPGALTGSSSKDIPPDRLRQQRHGRE